MDKETLEEAAERLSELQEAIYTTQHKVIYKHGFTEGAKWQAERSYSEEDMIEFAIWMYLEVESNSGKDRTNEELFKQWFEQFKKK
jgi:hypothetical protein